MTEVKSPCVRNCCLDDNDICMGCFRTLDEIKRWISLTQHQKMSVLKQSAQRKKLKN
ncbi:MAG: DUF1289 domain-containing protein [Gammaproteobacteria bacterium]|nr:DUF1289 domain-containing protein [Gammaproteobacteria bacterium]